MSEEAKALTGAACEAVIRFGTWAYPAPPGGGDQGEVILAGAAEVLYELFTSLNAIADTFDDHGFTDKATGRDVAEFASLVSVAAGQAQDAARMFRARHPLFFPIGER